MVSVPSASVLGKMIFFHCSNTTFYQKYLVNAQPGTTLWVQHHVCIAAHQDGGSPRPEEEISAHSWNYPLTEPTLSETWPFLAH